MYGQKNAKKRRFFSQCCDLFFGTSPCDGYEPEVKLQVTALDVCTGHSVRFNFVIRKSENTDEFVRAFENFFSFISHVYKRVHKN